MEGCLLGGCRAKGSVSCEFDDLQEDKRLQVLRSSSLKDVIIVVFNWTHLKTDERRDGYGRESCSLVRRSPPKSESVWQKKKVGPDRHTCPQASEELIESGSCQSRSAIVVAVTIGKHHHRDQRDCPERNGAPGEEAVISRGAERLGSIIGHRVRRV